MDITDIIGKGKAFEPPFKTDSDGMYIYDINNQVVLKTRGYVALRYIFNENETDEAYIALANHIVELLNERWKDETC